MKNKKRVLSGIRATGELHLGNYYGAVKGMLELQERDDYETLYMVADGHTITTPFEAESLRENRREIIIDYLAAGLDPEKSILFIQSDVAEHFEMAFLLSSVVSIARMSHLPTYKEKVKDKPESNTMALLNYPILMAADILLYKADLVPVGIDQEPHLEVAREIVRKMNQKYGLDLVEPRRGPINKGEYVPSLKGKGKMSKSDEGSYISLRDDLETIKRKLSKVPTDSGKGKIEEAVKAGSGVKTLIDLVELSCGEEKAAEYVRKYENEGISYKEMKTELAEAISEMLVSFQKKRKEIEENEALVDRVISEGREKAKEIANKTLLEVKKKMGLRG